MLSEKMTSSISRFRQKFNIGQFCIHFMRILAHWLNAKVGIREVPEGCRPIPAGHLNFDPLLAKALGGSSGVTPAVIHQFIANWVEYNRLRGKNFVDGRSWSYNSRAAWAEMIGLWDPKTVGKHLVALRDCGLLESRAMNAHKGDQTLWYTVGKNDSSGWEQLPLWAGTNALMGGANDSCDSSISQATNPQTTVNKRQQQQPRGRKAFDGAGVAQFPKRSLDPKESNDLKPEIRDAIPSEDGSGEEREAPPPVAPTPSPLRREGELETPAWMGEFFTGCTGDELMQILHQFGEALLKQSKAYAENEKHGIKNPPAFVRAQLEKGWRPPVDPAADETPTKPDLDWDTEKQVVWGPPPEPETPECAIWKRAYGQLEIQLDRASFDTWVRSARFLRCEGDTYVVGVANNYAREMLQHRLYRDIQRLVRNVADAEIQLQFEVYERVPVADEEIPLFRLLARQAEVK